jgi:WD40 repeat protein
VRHEPVEPLLSDLELYNACRVWDIAEGKCKHVLQNHENGTCVIGLPNGDIVVGSTGRKDGDKHVDYKIRVWRLDTSGGPPAYVTVRTIEDHEQAVRDLALMPGDTGYVSVGNDGMLAVRNVDHSVAFTFFNPMGPEDKPFSIFRVAVLPDGRIATASEDQTIRIYSLDGTISDFTLPGTPWAVAGLFNGDIAIGCGQAGRSKKGHVYVFSARPEGAADDMTTINFATDMEPPKKAEAG